MGLRVGNGQFKDLVIQIAQKERVPIDALERKKQLEEIKIKLFQDFKAKFSNLKTALDEIGSTKKLREFKVDLGGGEGAIDVTIDKDKVQPGSYEISIEQLAKRSSIISNSFTDPMEPLLGIGYVVVYPSSGEPFEIFIDEDESSLQQVANKINEIPDAPIQASVIKDNYDSSKPYRFILSAKKDGFDNGVEFPDFYFLGSKEDFWIEDSQVSDNAYIKVQDYEIEAESNQITDFVQGLNLKLKEARPGKPFTVTISEDFTKISVKIGKVVEELNKVLEFINSQNRVNEQTDTRTTFTGDTSLTNIEFRIRNLMHEGFPTRIYDEENFKLISLNEIGISFEKNGQLRFDENKFQSYLEKDYIGVTEMLSGDKGFVSQMNTLLKLYTTPMTGLLAMREQGMRSKVTQIDRDIEQKERLLERKMESIQQQFGKIEGSIARLQQQGSSLAAIGGGAGANPIAQLLG